LEFEEKSPLKHEFVNGFAYAMTGGSVRHGRIALNLATTFKIHLKRGQCEAFASDVRVVVQRDKNEIAYYPDVVVDCRRDTRDTHFVRDPRLIVEVLSPSTQRTDRREKLQNYRLIDSLEEYVLAAQDERTLTIHRRSDGWRASAYAGADAVAEFRSIGLALPLTEIYDGAWADGNGEAG
ncbi:MAG: Uma2 family endonuclease, partial [Steroidobacteraceae bacterium]